MGGYTERTSHAKDIISTGSPAIVSDSSESRLDFFYQSFLSSRAYVGRAHVEGHGALSPITLDSYQSSMHTREPPIHGSAIVIVVRTRQDPTI